MNYDDFLYRKSTYANSCGFAPIEVPDFLFPYQRHIADWIIRKGRAALWADCGLGKTAMQLVWADNVVRHRNGRVLILTPLAVAQQTEQEAVKFGVAAKYSRDGSLDSNIVISNYERMHYFNATDFVAVVCDEMPWKSFGGARRKAITRFMSKMDYRLICTANACPNDYVELGISSEALGELPRSEMLRMFFKQLDDKGQEKELKRQHEAELVIESDQNYFKKLAFRVSQTIGQYRLKHHAVQAFWRWVSSWAIACRMPSDLGFSDEGFVLPPLVENDHIITPRAAPGMLFNVPAIGMSGERDERMRTLKERCDFVADLVNHGEQAVVWCHLNPEGDLLAKMIPGAKQIAGKTPDDTKEQLYGEFSSGGLRVLVTKAKIGGWGLNWQNCAHVVTFPTHSYESYYQSVRRCYRFGQKRPVRLDVVATEGEVRVLGNMRRKAMRADQMFASMIAEMNDAKRVAFEDHYTNQMEQPAWLA